MKGLSEDMISKNADYSAFNKGKDYYEKGRVKRYSESDSMIKAVVEGSAKYKVTIYKPGFRSSCTCPWHSSTQEICKHIVAVMLTAVHGPKASEVNPEIARRNLAIMKFNDLIDSLSVDDLRSSIKQLGEEYALIRRHFNTKFLPKDKEYFEKTKQKIKHIVAEIIRSRYDYFEYDHKSGAVERDFGRLAEIADTIPTDRNSARFLLEQALAVYRRLGRYEELDGLASPIAEMMISAAIRFLNNLHGNPSDLNIFYDAMNSGYPVELTEKTADQILTNVKNREITDSFAEKLEMNLTGTTHNMLLYKTQMYELLTDYYEMRDEEKFNRLGREWEANCPEAIKHIIHYYFDKKKYERVVELAWQERTSQSYFEMVADSLKYLNRSEDMFGLYYEMLNKSPQSSLIRKFLDQKGLCRSRRAVEIAEMLLKNMKIRSLHELILFRLQRYEEFLAEVEKNGNEITNSNSYFIRLNELETFTKQLGPKRSDIAIALYRIMLSWETDRLKNATKYETFLGLINNLFRLGDTQYAKKLIEVLLKRYPTRKRLHDYLEPLVNKGI